MQYFPNLKVEYLDLLNRLLKLQLELNKEQLKKCIKVLDNQEENVAINKHQQVVQKDFQQEIKKG